MKNPFDVLMSMFRKGEAHEWAKWEDDFETPMSTQTLCDIRRAVERVYWEGRFSDKQILEAIRDAGGRVTHRPESETGDLCLVNLDKVYSVLSKK